jgi:hypothetical protein
MESGYIIDHYAGRTVVHRHMSYLVGTITRTYRSPNTFGGRLLGFEVRWADGDVTDEDSDDLEVMDQ